MIGREAYLGDAVYASFDGWQLRLRCAAPECEIFLEPSVYFALLEFVKSLNSAHSTQEPNPCL